ncbi:hypothetical protein COEREDRAFT_9937 [Coemansia reversa NRRL 1564]|uniref:Uncharacterized protein n=1 Tax=Coemansia reversa (strain ATCC 12441 / NRRL 1564) TaxID=763665 RepID=A0A2G5B741_COERN|nr:hypothetical protein COEREDRAFT_9937 [Coemansia reversa NRRL 1564]|eukprot:PIA14863.1 hypothetical protein COEREDRAFT_9937 [Coemansia reversa NRRL 1564]
MRPFAGQTAEVVGDREARRRARYRGNPDRARFHRQSDAEEFVIHVVEPRHDSRGGSSALVQGMRGISLTERKSMDSGYAGGSITVDYTPPSTCGDPIVDNVGRDSSSSPAIVSCNDSNHSCRHQHSTESIISEQSNPGLKQTHDSACHSPAPASEESSDILRAAEYLSAEESAAQAEPPEDPATPAQAEPPEDPATPAQSPEASESETALPGEVHATIPTTTTTTDKPRPRPAKTERRRPENKPAVGSARRQREGINVKDIEQVAQDASTRMTRSMARKLGGVQRPRRHFGEGVSATQILRPAGRQHSTPEP